MAREDSLRSGNRTAILDLLGAEDEPLDAEMIWRKISGKTRRINRSTVYRALKRLEEEGVILGVDLGARRGYRDARKPGTLCVVEHHASDAEDPRLDLIAQKVRSLFHAHGYRLHGDFEIRVTPLNLNA